MSIEQFYADLAADYHYVYPNWREVVQQQGAGLDKIIRAETGAGDRITVLDCACGVGTQALGLAQHGHTVTATDLSPDAVERAKHEAEAMGLSLTFGVADFTKLAETVEGRFTAVVNGGNSLAHMLTPADLNAALLSMSSKLASGGVLILGMRNYAVVLQDPPKTTIPIVHDTPEGRRIFFQHWEWDDTFETYKLNHFTLKEMADGWHTAHLTTMMRAWTHADLGRAMAEVGLTDVKKVSDSGYGTPLMVGRRTKE